MGTPYLKVFKEERDLTLFLIVDTSSSLHFGTGSLLNSELIAEVGAVLAFSAMKNHDRVGLIQFSDRVVKYVPPGKAKGMSCESFENSFPQSLPIKRQKQT